jgi:hypothetical protein
MKDLRDVVVSSGLTVLFFGLMALAAIVAFGPRVKASVDEDPVPAFYMAVQYQENGAVTTFPMYMDPWVAGAPTRFSGSSFIGGRGQVWVSVILNQTFQGWEGQDCVHVVFADDPNLEYVFIGNAVSPTNGIQSYTVPYWQGGSGGMWPLSVSAAVIWSTE